MKYSFLPKKVDMVEEKVIWLRRFSLKSKILDANSLATWISSKSTTLSSRHKLGKILLLRVFMI